MVQREVDQMQYKLINFRIPEPLFREFKAKVALEGVSMTEKLVGWIKEYVEGEEE
jgi:xanthosine utilization system XapX-like protein